MKYLYACLICLASAIGLSAQIITFDLVGQGGIGLLGSNSTGTPTTPGSGGELNTGITYDMGTSVLTIDVGWGSLNGFNDLSGAATAAHMHGPADQNNINGVIFALNSGVPGFNLATGANNGGITGSSDVSGEITADLLSGDWYINIHTSLNTGGEIRANLVPTSAVPEPSTYAFIAGLGALGLVSTRRRRTATEIA